MWCEYVFTCIDGIPMVPSIWTTLAVFFLASSITAFLFVSSEPGPDTTPMLVSLLASVVAGGIITGAYYALMIGILQHLVVIVTSAILIVGIVSSALVGKAVRNRRN
jgi:drug/metabolite transporter (DMT)-like permease